MCETEKNFVVATAARIYICHLCNAQVCACLKMFRKSWGRFNGAIFWSCFFRCPLPLEIFLPTPLRRMSSRNRWLLESDEREVFNSFRSSRSQINLPNRVWIWINLGMRQFRTVHKGRSHKIDPFPLVRKMSALAQPPLSVRRHHKFRKTRIFFSQKVRTSASEKPLLSLVRTGQTSSPLIADVFYGPLLCTINFLLL